jgi:putative membrane protein
MDQETDTRDEGLSRWKIGFALLFLAGLGVTIALVAWLGFEPVAAFISAAGMQLLWLGPYYAVPIFFAALAWRTAFAPGEAPRFRHVLVGAWIGLSINWLLPVAQIGGEFAKVRWLRHRGATGTQAGSSVMIDKTIQAFTQVVYALVGLVLLVWEFGERGLTPLVLLGCAVAGTGILVFYKLQRAGFFGGLAAGARRLSRRLAHFELNGASALDTAIGEGYSRRSRVLLVTIWRLLFRFTMAGEVWLAFYFMGHPISLVEAVILESLGQAVRAVAFAVPAGLGVQEAGFVLLGAVLGLGPEISLALSLAKRLRELLVGLPGLLVWQLAEGRILAGRLAAGRDARRRDADESP